MNSPSYKIKRVWPLWVFAIPVMSVSLIVILFMGYLAFFQQDIASSSNLTPTGMLAISALFMYPFWVTTSFIFRKNNPKSVIQMGAFFIGAIVVVKGVYPLLKSILNIEPQTGLFIILIGAFTIHYFGSKYLVEYCLERED